MLALGCYALSKYNVQLKKFSHTLIQHTGSTYQFLDSPDTVRYPSLEKLADTSEETKGFRCGGWLLSVLAGSRWLRPCFEDDSSDEEPSALQRASSHESILGAQTRPALPATAPTAAEYETLLSSRVPLPNLSGRSYQSEYASFSLYS